MDVTRKGILSSLLNAEIITKKLNANKKVSKDINVNDVRNVLTYVQQINSTQEDSYMIGDRPIDRIKIPGFCAPFILPKSIRFDAGRRGDVDYLVRDVEPSKPILYNEFVESVEKIASFMKADIEWKELTDIRKDVNIFDIYRNSVIEKDGNVDYDGQNPYIPIPISIDPIRSRDRAFTASEMIEDFIEWRLLKLF